MSTRAMIFIDGSWLAVTANRLADQHGLQGRTGGPLDFGALPRVCAQAIAAQMASATGLDVVRTHYFGSIATNFDTVDQDAVQRRSEFFDSLRRHHRYEVYRYETDYRGHRVRRTPGEEGFVPQEKAVDVGLATALLEMAAVSAYDIAIVVCGDRDFVPALQAVRRLGKRVAIVSARG
ncbi:MAG: NYN domain-containing protein, partial [Gemmatimonas sp.]